jgi:ribose 5-phosphate isomerase A
MIVIADSSKFVPILGKFPLPVEITPFGLKATLTLMAKEARAAGCEGRIDLRKNPSGHAYVSDNGNHIADCFFGAIPDPEALAVRFAAIPGCIEHGLFLGIATGVISAGPEGVEIFGHLD